MSTREKINTSVQFKEDRFAFYPTQARFQCPISTIYRPSGGRHTPMYVPCNQAFTGLALTFQAVEAASPTAASKEALRLGRAGFVLSG